MLAYITFCVVTALEYLHRELKVIHRDVKPSNTLIDKKGRVKVCDFGISGDLINSMAKTNVGSQPYLAPERINPERSGTGYSIRSDVWSLGLSVLELAICRFPYSRWSSLFDQLKDVVGSDTPPALPPNTIYSDLVRKFISRCLVKKDSDRASYEALIEDEMLTPFKNEKYLHESKDAFAEYVIQVLGG